MKVCYECLPCIVRQATEASKLVTSDEKIQKEIIKESILELGKLDFSETSPYLGRTVHKLVKEKTGIPDPYKELKERYNNVAMSIRDELKLGDVIEKSKNPFDTACRLSIAGNIIDFSVKIVVDESEVRESINQCLEAELFNGTTDDLRKAVMNSEKILFIADNAGEIVFDKMFIELLPKEKVTYVVKGGPIVNDATMEDAEAVNMSSVAKVVHNGADYQGTILSECSEEFKELFNDADLIISKGQANYETLSEIEDKKIFFLLKAKCRSIAEHIGCKHGEFVVMQCN